MELLGTSGFVAKKDQVKFYAPPDLVDRFGMVLDAQGLTLTEGMTRLMQLALLDPENLSPLLFHQVRGDVAKAVARHVLKKGKIAEVDKPLPPHDDIAPILHPDRPEQVMHPKKKRTG